MTLKTLTLTESKPTVVLDVDIDAIIPCQLGIPVQGTMCDRPATKRIAPKRYCSCQRNSCAPCIFALSELINNRSVYIVMQCVRCNAIFAGPGQKFSEIFTVRDL